MELYHFLIASFGILFNDKRTSLTNSKEAVPFAVIIPLSETAILEINLSSSKYLSPAPNFLNRVGHCRYASDFLYNHHFKIHLSCLNYIIAML